MPRLGIKSFGTKRWGKIVLLVLGIATVTLSFLFLGALISIPTMLIFGLALPIYLGWKVPRQLALAGLVILVVAAPLAALGDTSLILTPVGPVSSDPAYPSGNGNGSVLANAQVTPYQHDGAGSFVFTVNFQPLYIPHNDSSAQNLTLYVTTCPGATGPNSSNCNRPYPFYSQNVSLVGVVTAKLVTFQQNLSAQNVWWWTMSVSTKSANGTRVYIFLDPGNSYGTVQGPVTGSFASLFFFLTLPAFYEEIFLYAGLTFYFGLLVYVFFKQRERRRKEAQAAATAAAGVPTVEAKETTPPAGPALEEDHAGAPAPEERACPNCGAVVYLSESTCWKCGASLGPPASGPAPLPSSR